VQESRDLAQIVDALDNRGLLTGNLGVYGVSYGAATALQFAGRDPRVSAVVAIAPFSSLTQVVPDYVQRYLPVSTMVDDGWVHDAIARAGQLGHFDPREADCAPALAHTQAQVLLIHGGADANIPPVHSERLRTASPERTRLVVVEGDDHDTITWDRAGRVWRESTAWLDRWLDP
jgi:dipeptidyl aminopeptidase/acylaminoacyl peptidase